MTVRYLKADELLFRLLELKEQGNLDNYWIEIELEDSSSHFLIDEPTDGLTIKIEIEQNNSSYLLVDEPFDRDSTDGLIIIKARKQL